MTPETPAKVTATTLPDEPEGLRARIQKRYGHEFTTGGKVYVDLSSHPAIQELLAYADALLQSFNAERLRAEADLKLALDANAAQSTYRKQAEARAEAMAKDVAILDWLEDTSKCYWVSVQAQPNGEYIRSGQGQGLRAAIVTAIEQGAQHER